MLVNVERQRLSFFTSWRYPESQLNQLGAVLWPVTRNIPLALTVYCDVVVGLGSEAKLRDVEPAEECPSNRSSGVPWLNAEPSVGTLAGSRRKHPAAGTPNRRPIPCKQND